MIISGDRCVSTHPKETILVSIGEIWKTEDNHNIATRSKI